MLFVCYCYRKQLEETLQFYERIHKPAHEPKPPVITESFIGIVILCIKMGEQQKEEDYLEKVLQELKFNFRKAIPLELSVSSAWKLPVFIQMNEWSNLTQEIQLWVDPT